MRRFWGWLGCVALLAGGCGSNGGGATPATDVTAAVDTPAPVEDTASPPVEDVPALPPDVPSPLDLVVPPDLPGHPDVPPVEDVGCVPDCDARACGDDGCGGSCGDCPEAHRCVDGGCTARPCRSLAFDGEAAWADCGDAAALRVERAITVEAWLRTGDAYRDWQGYVSYAFDSGADESGYEIAYYGGEIRFRAIPSERSGVMDESPGFAPDDHTWYHVAGTYDGRRTQLFVDGALVDAAEFDAEADIDWRYQDGGLLLGTFHDDNEDVYAAGHLAEVRVWSRVLDAAELRAGRFGLERPEAADGLVGYWTLDEGEGDRVVDRSGGGHDCTLHGATWSDDAPGSVCCAAACGERACGTDGCGGSCGDCAAGLQCEAGSCVEPPPVGLRIPPYLQHQRTDGITVMWETDEPCFGAVVVTPPEGEPWTVRESLPRAIHEVTIDELTADTRYGYQVLPCGVEALAGELWFRTAPGRPVPFRFAIWGDSRSQPDITSLVAAGIAGADPALVVHVGDVVTNGDNYEEWAREYLLPMSVFSGTVPSYVAVGNHERDAHWFYDYVSQPAPENWAAFTYGDARFVLLDTNYPYHDGSEQNAWLMAELASEAYRDAKWRFFFFHHPPYSEQWDSPGYTGDPLVALFLVPILLAADADGLFVGHTHDYERGFVGDEAEGQMAYVLTGGGGAPLDTVYNWDWEQVDFVASEYHYTTVDLDGDTATFTPWLLNGDVLDTFEIRK